MKMLLAIFFVLLSWTAQAQETAPKKPKRVIIVNDTIVPYEKVEEYSRTGYIKAIMNGVSETEMKTLQEKFGEDAMGDDRRFVTRVELLTEAEKKEQDSRPKPPPPPPQAPGAVLVLKENDRAADFTANMLDGQQIKLSDLKGKVVLVNFWATWCGPCMMEFSEIPSQILEPFKNKDFVFIPISRGETKEKVAEGVAELKKKGIDFNVALDPDKKIWDQYGKSGIPKNFLIDQQGVIRYVSTGYGETSVKKLADEINKLLK